MEADRPSLVPSLTQLAISAAAKYLEYDQLAIARLPEDLVEKVLAWMIERLPPNQHRQLNQTISVKINLTRQNHTWGFRFLQSMTVGQAVSETYARLTEDPFTVEEYALFLRASDAYSEDQWLDPDRSFSYYEIKSGAVLEFRPKMTMVKIDFLGHWEKIIHPLHHATLEATSKTFLIDESQCVARMAEDIARKLGLRFPHEFMLKLPTNDPTVPARWLNPDLTLAEQKIDPLQTKFFFCKMYSFSPWTETITRETDYPQLHFLFCQCVDAIVNVLYPCTLQESIYLAALQCQSTYGDYGVMSFNGIDLKTADYLPPEHCNAKGCKEMIFEIYQKLKGMSEVKAKTEYVRLVRSLKSYGYTCFPVRRVVLKGKRDRSSTNSHKDGHMYLGLAHDSIMMLDVNSKQLEHRLPITQVEKWQVLHSSISIVCTDSTYEFLTEEAASVSAVLNAYITFNLRNQPDVLHRWSLTYQRIGREYRRSRSGTDTDSREYNAIPAGVEYHQCQLYVEPKKMYRSPIMPGARPVARPPSTGPAAHPSVNPVKLHKIVKMLKTLNQLAGKMVQPEAQVARRTLRLNIQLANGHLQSAEFPDTRIVSDIATDIGLDLGIRNPEEFSLQVNDGKNMWLDPYLSIEAQHVDPQQTLLYKRKFYYNEDSEDFSADPIYYNLLFYQSRDEILGNNAATNMEEAVQLAATLFQINFGDWNENIHKPGFLHFSELKFFLCPTCLDLWGVNFSTIEKMIYAEHRKLLGMTRGRAKFRYLLLCKQLKSYGTTMFPVGQGGKDGKKLKPHPSVPYATQTLHCSKDRISVVDQRTKKGTIEFPLTHLHGWSFDPATMLFTFWFGNYEEEKFSFFTSEGQSISQWLSHYIDFLQSKRMGRLWSRDLGIVTLN